MSYCQTIKFEDIADIKPHPSDVDRNVLVCSYDFNKHPPSTTNAELEERLLWDVVMKDGTQYAGVGLGHDILMLFLYSKRV